MTQTKKKAQHTPGPWTLGQPVPTDEDESIGVLVDDGGRMPLVCEVWQSYTSHEQALADAHLIKAAPDLLAALEGLVSAADYMNWPQTHDVWQNARTAIAKARGE